MSNDLYIILLFLIAAIVGLLFIYVVYKKYEIGAAVFAISPIISTLFFDNLPELDIVETTEATIGLGGYIRAAVLIIIGTIGIFKYFQFAIKTKGKLPLQLVIMGIFILLAYASSFYSIDQRFTLIRSTLLLSVLGFLLGLYTWLRTDGSVQKLLNSLFILAVVSIFVSYVLLFTMPSRAWWWKAGRLISLFEHPNNFGAFCMLLYPVLLWKYFSSNSNTKYFVLILIGLNLILHILSGSRTTLISSAVGVLIWFLLEKKWLQLFGLLIIMAIFAIGLITYSPQSLTRQEQSELTDLSSREDIWESANIFVNEKPIIGYGFGVEGKIFQNEQKLDLGGSFIEKNVRQSLHNGYLSIIIGLGFSGLLVWLILIFYPVVTNITVSFSHEKDYAIITIIMILITNFFESALTGYSLATDTFFWIAWLVSGTLWLQKEKDKVD